MKFDMGFGNPVAVRHAFLNIYNQEPIVFNEAMLDRFNYPEHEGDKEIISLTRQVIRRQIGLDYKHILLTNGATGAVVIALRAYQQAGMKKCITRDPPYYLRYPRMIAAAGLPHRYESVQDFMSDGRVFLWDMPSNPLGHSNGAHNGPHPLILDGVYYNNVYTSSYIKPIPHDVMIGSYSKLLGLSGLRIGWIATDNDLLYERLKDLVTSEYCGLSMSSTILLKSMLKGFNWDKFEVGAREALDFNREEWSKLERFFGGRPVKDVGMFYYADVDSACRKLLEKSGIKWMDGSLLGTDDKHGRFSLGQDCHLTQDAVKEILKNDKLF